MNTKDKVHVVISLTAYDSNGDLVDCKDLSHLFNPHVGERRIALVFGIPILVWGFRVTRKKSTKILLEMSVDDQYASRTYVRTDHGWEITARTEFD